MNPFQRGGLVLLAAAIAGLAISTRRAWRKQAEFEEFLARPKGHLDAFLSTSLGKFEDDLTDAAPGSFIEHKLANAGVLRIVRSEEASGPTFLVRWTPERGRDDILASIVAACAATELTAETLSNDAMEIRSPDRYVIMEFVELAFLPHEDEEFGDLRWDITDRAQIARNVE